MSEILFLHGLESGPNGSKTKWLKAKFGEHAVHAVDLDTSHAQASVLKAKELGTAWDHTWPDIEADFAVPLAHARAAITPETKLIIGSSFGAAVLTRLIQEGTWKGPSLLIASAGLMLTGKAELPTAAPVALVHGMNDDVIPWTDSGFVLDANGSNVEIWLTDDGHRMENLSSSGMFDFVIDRII